MPLLFSLSLSRTCTNPHTHTHTHTHLHTHPHTHLHTQTHTHAHTFKAAHLYTHPAAEKLFELGESELKSWKLVCAKQSNFLARLWRLSRDNYSHDSAIESQVTKLLIKNFSLQKVQGSPTRLEMRLWKCILH